MKRTDPLLIHRLLTRGRIDVWVVIAVALICLVVWAVKSNATPVQADAISETRAGEEASVNEVTADIADPRTLMVTVQDASPEAITQAARDIASALGVEPDAVQAIVPQTVLQAEADKNQTVSQTLVVPVPENTSLTAVAQTVQQATDAAVPNNDNVIAEPNLKRKASRVPNDPLYSNQWHHSGRSGSINSPQGWDANTGSSSLVIAVVDSGVDTDHPDLASNMWVNTDEIPSNGHDDDDNGYTDDVYGFDFTSNTPDPNPTADGADEDHDGEADNGVVHGTHIAGLIAARGNNGVGVTGISWNSKIMAVQVLDDEGSGFDADIAEGIRYAADNGADIINLSLGGAGSTTVLANAVQYALGKGAIVVAAAGNEGANLNNTPYYPICYADVIGVASVGQSGAGSDFSNYGSDCVDISAPGEGIYSTFYTGDAPHGFSYAYGYESGTSMAAPIVAGVVALTMAQNPTASRDQITSLLLSSARGVSGLSTSYGEGVVDASKVGSRVLMRSVSGFSSSKKTKKLKPSFVYAHRQPYFQWGVNGSDAIAYYVYFGTNKSAEPKTAGKLQSKKTFKPSKKISGNEKKYYLRVQAIDASNRLSNTLTYEYIIDTIVSAPGSVKGKQVPGKRQARITWKKVPKQNVTEYQVFRQDPGAKKARLLRKVKHPTERFVDGSVQSGKTYTYYVKTKDDLGNAKSSKKVRVTIK